MIDSDCIVAVVTTGNRNAIVLGLKTINSMNAEHRDNFPKVLIQFIYCQVSSPNSYGCRICRPNTTNFNFDKAVTP